MSALMAEADTWLPLAFLGLMGLSVLIYVSLDGFDLGVGVLLPLAPAAERSLMVASIGPFWDANETWLVLGVGILLVAFPVAHGVVLGALYLPVTVMLIGLTLRGVAFEMRAKAAPARRRRWDGVFSAGSLLAALAQGYMLGAYVIGFAGGAAGTAFAVLVAVCLLAAYVLLGACWLLLKAEGALQRRALRWARLSLWPLALGVLAISMVTPMVSARVFERWFALPGFLALLPVPLLTAALLLAVHLRLRGLARAASLEGPGLWQPFAAVIAVFVLCFVGLAYSFYPYVVPDRLTVWEAASATESLAIVFGGALLVLPVIVAYTVFLYRVFGGKTRPLDYG